MVVTLGTAWEDDCMWDTGTVVTGTVKARAMSEFCWTGDVAVWAVLSFSFLRHLALLF